MRGVLTLLLLVLVLLAGCATTPAPAQVELDPQQQELAETVQKYSWSNNRLENYPIVNGTVVVSLFILQKMALGMLTIGV
jgi:hypothetical protein